MDLNFCICIRFHKSSEICTSFAGIYWQKFKKIEFISKTAFLASILCSSYLIIYHWIFLPFHHATYVLFDTENVLIMLATFCILVLLCACVTNRMPSRDSNYIHKTTTTNLIKKTLTDIQTSNKPIQNH